MGSYDPDSELAHQPILANHAEVYFFGDQTANLETSLGELLYKNDDSALSSFFDRIGYALRQEVAQLPAEDRSKFPCFNTLSELLAKYAEFPKSPPLDMALTCVHQFALYSRSRNSDDGRSSKASRSFAAGLCVGLLVGATVSSSDSLTEILSIAVEVVLLAFRTGRLSEQVGNRIEIPKASPSSWSTVLPSLSHQRSLEMIEEYNNSKEISPTSRLYLSATAASCVTISGPPMLLEDFVRAEKLEHIKLSITSPYHAPHLYGEGDVIQLLAPLSRSLDSISPKTPLFSSSTGKIFQATTLKSLLLSVLQEILFQTLSLDKVNNGIASTLKYLDIHTCHVVPIATDARGLTTTLKTKAELEILIKNPSTESVGETNQSGRPERSKLAIIGYSGRFPSAQNNEEYWRLIHGGRDVHSITPPQRWDVKTHVDPSGKRKNTSATPYGCWLEDPGLFDARFFNITPREAPQVDPAQRLALMSAYEAIEMAGLVPDSTPSTIRSRVGIFIGSTSNDWCETNSAQNVDSYFIPGGNRAFIPGRINYHFKFSGPSYSVDTACSSSLAAIHIACNALWRGDCDTVIAGGTNVMTNPDVTAGLDRGHFLSRTGNCKTFDDGADGYCRGEGIGTVILKRLEDAIADNDPIHGCISGAYTNHSAEAESITRPHVGAQRDILKTVLTQANVMPSSVSYVEMHGTGTQAGDSREMQSVLEVFAPSSGCHLRRKDQELFLGSVKANIGHGESASGVSALIKVLLMMKNNEIPPHCGIKSKINGAFPSDLEERNVHIATKPTVWERTSGTRRTVINNFSAAGGNSSILVEDAPIIPKRAANEDRRMTQLIAVSGKTSKALQKNTMKMVEFIAESHNLSLQDLAYTTTVRRIHHRHRLMVSGNLVGEIGMQLRKSLSQDLPGPGKPAKIAFAFTGQGQQYPGLGQYFYQTDKSYRQDINNLDAIGTGQGFPSIIPYVEDDSERTKSYSPLIEQLATTCTQMAITKLWRRWGITPSVIVCHSLGEYAALNAAGVVSDSDTIWLCGKRAELLVSHCTQGSHAMVAVSGNQKDVCACLAGQQYEVACINSPAEIVLCGQIGNIDSILSVLKQNRFKATKLNVPYAFHSSQVDPILSRFGQVARGASFHKPQVPILSPLLGSVIEDSDSFSSDYFVRHCRETVNLKAAVEAALEAKILSEDFHVIEIGPHPVVSNLLKSNLGSKTTVLASLHRGKDTSKVVIASLTALYTAGVDVKWSEYHRDYTCSVLMLPSYSWELENYWIQYVHDWSLRKGEPLPIAAALTLPKMVSTACCQEVVREIFTETTADLTIESNLQRSDLDQIMRAHRVNNVAMCTSTVYAEIALTLGRYLLTRHDLETLGVVLENIDVKKPLLTKSLGTFHKLQARIQCDWNNRKAQLEFHSIEGDHEKSTLHAVGSLYYVDDEAEREALQQASSTIRSRIEELKLAASTGSAMRLRRSPAYRLFGLFVQYGEHFRGLREITLHSEKMEAYSNISFSGLNLGQPFPSVACLMDSFGQTAGFTMNSNDNVDLDKEVHLNTGCDYIYFSGPLDPAKEYEAYVKMEASKGGLWSGDVTIFEAGQVIGVYRQIKFQGVPRRLLSHIIGTNAEAQTHQKPLDPYTAGNNAGEYASSTLGSETPELVGSATSLNSALAIISEESGIPLLEMNDDSAFAEMGVDSLLTLMIAGRFREELELDLEQSFFTDHPTIGAVKDFFGRPADTNSCKGFTIIETQQEITKSKKTDFSSVPVSPITIIEHRVEERTEVRKPETNTLTESLELIRKNVMNLTKPAAKSTSIVLQGMPKKAKKTLFLFPDGCGSASSYGQIPKVHPDIAIVGLNCPYMKTPEDMTGTLEDMAGILLAEVRRRQPHGPYCLGGWSAGGVLAYSAAQQLLEVGEVAERLILIDSPCPVDGFERLPTRFVEYCDSIHLFGEYESSGFPTWLLPHFAGINEILHAYKAKPFPGLNGPKTHMIWACDAVDKYLPFTQKFKVLATDPDDILFLISDRADFGTNGWHKLVGDRIEIEISKGSNHFTIMQGEHVAFLARFIERALLG